jgi:hypothetical protein
MSDHGARRLKMPKLLSMVLRVCTAALCILGSSLTSQAGDEFLYANNAGSTSTDYVWQIDLTTGGNVSNEFAIPGIGNGRGVIDVNNTLYVTTASSGNVYSFNIGTSALATAFTVSGSSALASITYDGTNFWIGDYTGTDKAFLYTPGGTLLKTISLSNCTGLCDGLTFVALNGGELLENRFDGVSGLSQYDLYDTNGNLLKADFIDTTGLGALPGSRCHNSTGVAWDGTDFFVSCLFTTQLAEFGANGNFLKFINLDTSGTTNNGNQGPLMEGLSANFAVTIPPTVPEPGSLSLLALGLAGTRLFRRKRTA